MVDFSTAAGWDAAYSIPVNGRVLGYERAAKPFILGNDHWNLLKALNIQVGQKIILIGSGFGWIAEDWIGAGYGPIVACDTSPYIQANLSGNASVPVLNQSSLTSQSQNAVRGALGGKPDWVISEDVMPALADADASALAAAMRQYRGAVAHWVTVLNQGALQDPTMNWKSAADWKAFLAPDLIVQRGAATVA